MTANAASMGQFASAHAKNLAIRHPRQPAVRESVDAGPGDAPQQRVEVSPVLHITPPLRTNARMSPVAGAGVAAAPRVAPPAGPRIRMGWWGSVL